MELFEVLDREAGPDANAFYSPVSLEQAFGLVHAGAAGETQAQIEDVFGWPRGEAADRQLGAERQTLLAHGTPADIRLANALWLKESFEFAPSYLETTERDYAATARRLDFQGDPAGSAKTINAWASDQTKGLIPQAVNAKTVADQTAAFLTNALYFEAGWEQPFGDGAHESPFLFGDGSERPFYLMTNLGSFAVAEHGNWQAVRMPYSGRRFAMDVIMLKRREVMDAAPDLATLAELDGQLANAEPELTDLRLPRFEIDYDSDLVDQLAGLGLTLPFDPAQADLSRMTGATGPGLYVGAVYQLTKLQVYAEGTKAAAVTVVQMMVVSGRSTPDPKRSFVVDRPFVSVIRDLDTGQVLFIGRIADPKPFEPIVEDPDGLLSD